MTDEEKKLVLACGTFCHVTTQENADIGGLDPSSDMSVVIRGPKRPQAVYLCPESSLDKALNVIGDRARGEKALIVFKVAAAVLAVKSCGPDFGWLSAHIGGAELEAATVKTSLDTVGAIACYDLISPGEISETVTVPNPKFDPEAGKLI